MKFAIVGTGTIAKIHKKAIESSGNKLIGVFSKNINRGEKFGKKFKCKAYEKYENLIEDSNIDAIIIANENYLHSDYGIQAANFGKHLLIEKPIDINLNKAQKLIEVCKNKKVVLSINFQRRFDSNVQNLKNKLAKNEFGEIYFVSAYQNWHRPKKYYLNNWKNDIHKSGGGVLMIQAIHLVDILYYLFGPVKSVLGRSKKTRNFLNVEDYVDVSIKFKNGIKAQIISTTAAEKNFPDRLNIIGERDTIFIKGREIINKGILTQIKSKFNKYGTHQDVIQNFVESIEKNREPLTNGKDGLNILKIILAVYESIKLNKEVILND